MRTCAGWVFVALLSCGLAMGQANEKVLYSFTGSPDGTAPVGKLVADSAGNLYGTTSAGGSTAYCEGCGTVFELSPNADGTYREAILYNFCQSADRLSCLDGSAPQAGLVADSAGNLYGTTFSGGGDQCTTGGGCGTVFELSPPVSGSLWVFTQLYQFCQIPGQTICSDGALPLSRTRLARRTHITEVGQMAALPTRRTRPGRTASFKNVRRPKRLACLRRRFAAKARWGRLGQSEPAPAAKHANRNRVRLYDDNDQEKGRVRLGDVRICTGRLRRATACPDTSHNSRYS